MQRQIAYVNWTQDQARKQTDPRNKHGLHINIKSINGTQITLLGSRQSNIYTKIRNEGNNYGMHPSNLELYRTMRNEINVLIFTIKDQ
jgi:hypothetical protein